MRHGTIGLIVTLAWLRRIKPGHHRIETPVGIVDAQLHESGEVTVRNVPCYRHAKDAAVQVEDFGIFTGDVAWGGNWFYLLHTHKFEIAPRNVAQLTDFASRVRGQLRAQGVTGAGGAEIDHIELSGPAQVPYADSKNFMLCPGGNIRPVSVRTGNSRRWRVFTRMGN